MMSPPNKPTITADSWAPYWLRALIAIAVGMALYKGSMMLLDVHLAWFRGLQGFDVPWLVAMSVVPVAVGVVIGVIYGFGGKYVAHFPPAFVMLWDYQHTHLYSLPQGVHVLPWGIWVMFVILQMEFCAVGGFIGEILIRKRFSWDDPNFRPADSVPLPEDEPEERS
ncbi:MAG: hypothetical protein D6678_00545 [Zetaproteobacteria bacterium]|nr:MAG: hypothetical protein D6678_00545 [Zetaproteobacteria bacterium]